MASHIARPLNKCQWRRVWRHCRRYAATQTHLPNLPVPPLNGTIAELKEAADLMLSPSEYKATCQLLEDFTKKGGDGEKLQNYLQHRAGIKDNWLNDYIQTEQYLTNRNPLPIYQNAGLSFPFRLPLETLDERLTVTSKLIVGVVDSVEKMESPDFRTETMGGMELDMSQFNERFKIVRVAGYREDTVEEVSDKDRHMVLAHNNQFFRINLYDSKGNRYKEGQIWKSLKDAVSQSPNKGLPIGILTGDDRDIWGDVYTKLKKDEVNRASLDDLHKALLIVCLDGTSPQPSGYDQASSDALNVLHGGGANNNGANRFYDNEFQFVITSDGALGNYGGQCLANAWILQFPLKNTMKFLTNPELPGVEESDYPKSKKLQFNIDENTEKIIQESCKRFERLVQSYDMVCSRFDKFGKTFIKSCGVSPDSYIHLAIGLALMKLYNRGGYDFEHAHTRKFTRGRTGIVRTCFKESVEFNKAMMNAKTPDDERIQSFISAAKVHQDRIKLAMEGFSATRHLQGLRCAVSDLRMKEPQLFQDPGFQKITKPRCFSTQIPSPGMVYAINSLFDSQFSTGFVPLEDEVLWSVCTSAREDVSAKKFHSTICESMMDIHDLFQRQKST